MTTPEGLTEAEYQGILSDAAADAHNANLAYWGTGVLVFVLVILIFMPRHKKTG